jgi:UDP-MurNAc hydroxylase
MKFTILSHAGLEVESDGLSLVIDPWLVGSCYWRSWWNYPPPPRELIRRLRPDFIYVTHLHWDHFHGVSLRRFDRKTPVLVPRAYFGRMVEDLASMGFSDVREMTHGKGYRVGEKMVLTSYQFGPTLDSALVVDTGEVVLLDANDCKLMGGPLRQVTRRHPRIDFVLKSYSSASPYPYCVSSEFPDHLTHRSREDYLEEFLVFAEAVKARYAIPFASNHCFLHRETRRFNDTVVLPHEVKQYFDRNRQGTPECVVMLAGDSWSTERGFEIAPEDYYTRRDGHLDELAEQYRGKLERTYEREDRVAPDFASFKRYFSDLLAALPIGFRLLMPARVMFHVTGNGEANWLVDFSARSVTEHAGADAAHDFRIDMHAAVLRDCCQKQMFSTFSASKRVHYHLRTRKALRYMNIYNSVMDLYEAGCFPVSGMLSRRFAANWSHRWRELGFYARAGLWLAMGRELRPADFIRAG